jgi:hypothetical protein
MANLGLIASAASQAIRNDYNPVTGQPANPMMQWPATGGHGGVQINMRVYVAVVAPTGSIAAGGPTTGQLFPVGNR